MFKYRGRSKRKHGPAGAEGGASTVAVEPKRSCASGGSDPSGSHLRTKSIHKLRELKQRLLTTRGRLRRRSRGAPDALDGLQHRQGPLKHDVQVRLAQEQLDRSQYQAYPLEKLQLEDYYPVHLEKVIYDEYPAGGDVTPYQLEQCLCEKLALEKLAQEVHLIQLEPPVDAAQSSPLSNYVRHPQIPTVRTYPICQDVRVDIVLEGVTEPAGVKTFHDESHGTQISHQELLERSRSGVQPTRDGARQASSGNDSPNGFVAPSDAETCPNITPGRSEAGEVQGVPSSPSKARPRKIRFKSELNEIRRLSPARANVTAVPKAQFCFSSSIPQRSSTLQHYEVAQVANTETYAQQLCELFTPVVVIVCVFMCVSIASHW